MRRWVILCSIGLLSVLLLAGFLGELAVPSRAHAAAGSGARDVAANTSVNALVPITRSWTIEPGGAPWWLRDVGVVLEFDPGATGVVTVAMSPATPQDPPLGGAVSRSWWITTTSSAYEVTTTFIYSDVVRDIALLLDSSGSMEFDTLCYGCWEKDADDYVFQAPCRDGICHPLPWDGPANGTPERCESLEVYQDDGYDYYFIEAEEYSYTNNAFSRATYGTGYSYWVLQRQPSTTSSRDGRGGHIMHMPFPDMEVAAGAGVTCRHEDIDSNGDGYVTDTEGFCWSGASLGPFKAPRVDYNFSPLTDDGYYIWVRGQASGAFIRSDDLDRRLFWGIDQTAPDDGLPVQLGWGQSGSNCGGRLGCEGDFMRGGNQYTDGATSWNWEWRRLNDSPYNMVAGTQYNLSFWAGGSHFALDRIVITNDHNNYDYLEPLQANSERGVEEWANGRGGYACEPCDDRFAGYPADHSDRPPGFVPSDPVAEFPVCEDGPNPDRRYNYLYDDEQPMRGAVEAFKTFASDNVYLPYDQVGYVRYSSVASTTSPLQCLRRLGAEDCTADVISDTVIAALENTYAGGSTNIAAAILEGIDMLGVGPQVDCELGTGPCGYPNAVPMMILMTDGRPVSGPTNCPDLWPNDGEYDAYEDCVIQYAYDARDQNVIINTVTIGEMADFALMAEIADLTGGVFWVALRPEHLSDVFEDVIGHHIPPFASGYVGLSPGESPRGEAIYRRTTPADDWTLYPVTMTQIFTSGWAVAEGITALSEWTVGYLAPHRVVLEAVPGALPADGLSTAILTATVTDVYSQPVQDGTVVTFATSLGSVLVPGTAVLPHGVTSGGIVTAILSTGLEPGWADVSATTGGVTGTTLVEFEALSSHQIVLEAVPGALPADGLLTAILTATVTDVYSQPVQDGTVVTFATSLGSVSVPGTVVLPHGVTSGGIVTAILSTGLEPGWASVSATTGEVTGTTLVEFEALPPYRVVLQAVPAALPADGLSTAILTATITDVYSQPVQDGTVVTFATSLGSVATVPGSAAWPYGVTSGGVVTATLTTGLESGWATVSATAGEVTGTTLVEFGTLLPYRVSLEAVPAVLSADELSTAVLTATVVDVYSQAVRDGTVVTFATSLGTVSPALDVSAGGVVTAFLTAGLEPGLAVVTATAKGEIGTVQVHFVVRLYLPLVLRNYDPAVPTSTPTSTSTPTNTPTSTPTPTNTPTSTPTPTPTNTPTGTPTPTPTPTNTPTSTSTPTPTPTGSPVTMEPPTSQPTIAPTPPPGPTPPPLGYCLDIGFDYATNLLPFERGHLVPVTVVECNTLVPQPDLLVAFDTTRGAYDYSGLEVPVYQQVWSRTDANGYAEETIYANDAFTATLRAWVDVDGDGNLDAGEANDVASKAWFLSGAPRILASDYEVDPGDQIDARVFDHPEADEMFSLLWCRTSSDGGIESSVLFTNSIDVDVNGDATLNDVEIPGGSEGDYRLKTYPQQGPPLPTCADAPTAESADIRVLPSPPDLIITDISYPDVYGDVLPAYAPIPFRVEIYNDSSQAITDTFVDVDVYIDPPAGGPTAGQISAAKQWLADIAAGETEVVTIEVNMDIYGSRVVWAEVDISDYVVEQNEENNSFSYQVQVDCGVESSIYGDDFEASGLDGKWMTAEIEGAGGYDVDGSVTQDGGGYLDVSALGRRIWDTSDNFFYVYQSVSGDFDVRLRVVYPPPNSGAKAGVMVRNSIAAGSSHVLVAARDADGGRLQFMYRGAAGDSSYYVAQFDPAPASPPVWVRIVRAGDDFGYYYSYEQEPTNADWVQQPGPAVSMDETVLLGIAHAKYSTSAPPYTSRVDEFVVCQAIDEPPLSVPGLEECAQLCQAGGFEGDPETVFEHWNAGGDGAFQRTGYMQYEGAFSMRLHASLGSYPECNAFSPWLSQTVQIPDTVYTQTSIVVGGYRAVGGSLAECSVINSTDADDALHVRLLDGAGIAVSDSVTLAHGGAVAETWEYFEVELGDGTDWTSFAGQDVQVYFSATHDADVYGTWFYLDDVTCHVCSTVPIPDPEPGMASFGGLVSVGGMPLEGVRVVAYSQGGEVYRTISIQDHSYHFYNVPPGTYVVHAQAWINNTLMIGSNSVTVVSDEHGNDGVDLYLN